MWDEDDIPMIRSSPSPLPKKPQNSVVFFLHPKKQQTSDLVVGFFGKKTLLKKKILHQEEKYNLIVPRILKSIWSPLLLWQSLENLGGPLLKAATFGGPHLVQ